MAAGAYRRSSPVLGLLVVEATESLASPVSWSHHFIWMILLVAWLALAEDRPRAGEWYALGVAVLLWAAPYWWVPHGPSVRFAGRGWKFRYYGSEWRSKRKWRNRFAIWTCRNRWAAARQQPTCPRLECSAVSPPGFDAVLSHW